MTSANNYIKSINDFQTINELFEKIKNNSEKKTQERIDTRGNIDDNNVQIKLIKTNRKKRRSEERKNQKRKIQEYFQKKKEKKSDISSKDDEKIQGGQNFDNLNTYSIKKKKINKKKNNDNCSEDSYPTKNFESIQKSKTPLNKEDDIELDYYAKKLNIKSNKKIKEDDIFDKELDEILNTIGDQSSEQYSELESENDSLSENENNKDNPFVVKEESDEFSNKKENNEKHALTFTSDEELVVKIKQEINKIFNKLTVTNFDLMIQNTNNLYNENPKLLVLQCMTETIIHSVLDDMNFPDSFLYLLGMYVSVINHTLGDFIVTAFIKTFFKVFFENYELKKFTKLSNMIVFFSSIFEFNLISPKLVFDLYKFLLEDINDETVILSIKLIKTTFIKLKIDNPKIIKEIYDITINKYKSFKKEKISIKLEFFFEQISLIKTSKFETTKDLGKIIIDLKKKFKNSIKSKSVEPLQFDLNDFLNNGNKRSWSLERTFRKDSDLEKKIKINNDDDKSYKEDKNNLLHLASVFKMNTSVRKMIFVAIFSSNDYVNAIENLNRLDLKKNQKKEIPVVILNCVVLESDWNPFYGIIASKLCKKHFYKRIFQLFFWEYFRKLDDYDKNDFSERFLFVNKMDPNLRMKEFLKMGRFFGFLLSNDSIRFSCLKEINFLTCSSDLEIFLEIFLISFLDEIIKLHDDNNICLSQNLTNKVEQIEDNPKLLKSIYFFAKNKVDVKSLVLEDDPRRKVIHALKLFMQTLKKQN